MWWDKVAKRYKPKHNIFVNEDGNQIGSKGVKLLVKANLANLEAAFLCKIEKK